MKYKILNSALLKIYDLLYAKFGPRHWWPGDTRIEVIIGAILTQNTAWRNVEKAIHNLKKEKMLSASRLSDISEKKLAALIKPSGCYNVKANRIKIFLKFLNVCYNGSISKMFKAGLCQLREELLALKGIGQETADSILLYAGGKPVLVVDAYTKRVFLRHGFISQKADYKKIQSLFMNNLPENVGLFNEFHALIVELGKSVCKSKKPLCNICPIRSMRRKQNARRNKKTG
ncbi:MAG: endonuclease III domain-containing protein [Candidatus Omnitrophica bacterium]|nr:endonuclease III domain-containing protein [Candidatus Omnitrophota bacterium]